MPKHDVTLDLHSKVVAHRQTMEVWDSGRSRRKRAMPGVSCF